MNYPYNIGCCNNCGNSNNNSQKCSSCNEPEPTTTTQDHDCIRRSNECYRPECNVTQVIDGKEVTINSYEEIFRECPNKPSQCKGCSNAGCCTANCHGCRDGGGFCQKVFRESEQKKIWNQVRVPSSMYMMNLTAMHVYETPAHPSAAEWNAMNPAQQKQWLEDNFNTAFKKGVRHQMSDRLQLSNRAIPGKKNPTVIPSRGNTTRRTTTAHRPGASRPGGVGVDVKHDSYARYLARKKGKVLTKSQQPKKPLYGNKSETYNIINKQCCPVNFVPSPCADKIMNNLPPPRQPCYTPTQVDLSGCSISYQ